MSSYNSYEPQSNFGLYVFLAFIAAALLAVGVYFVKGGDEATPSASPANEAKRKSEGD